MIKKISFLLLTFVILSCSNDENQTSKDQADLKKSLEILEKKIRNHEFIFENQQRGSVDVATDYNDFDYVGENYLVFLDEFKQFVKTIHPSEGEINQYMEEKLAAFPELNINIDPEIFQLIGQSAGSSLNGAISGNTNYTFVEIMKIYEDFTHANISKSTEGYNELMVVFSFYKWLGFDYIDDQYEAKGMACSHRDCWDCCMWRSFRDYNWTETIAFIASPGASAAIQGISCAEDCW